MLSSVMKIIPWEYVALAVAVLAVVGMLLHAQNKAERLSAELGAAEVALESQRQATEHAEDLVRQWAAWQAHQEQVLRQMEEMHREASTFVNDLARELADADLRQLAIDDPEVLEAVVNARTRSLLDRVRDASGVPGQSVGGPGASAGEGLSPDPEEGHGPAVRVDGGDGGQSP